MLLLLACLTNLPDPNADVAVGQSAVELGKVLRGIVLAHLPNEYENKKDWGGTKQVWDGVRISLDGLRIKTKRRRKDANHGTWKRYRAWLIDPDRNLKVLIANIRESDEGRAAFDLTVHAQLGAFGRLSEWRRDVQLYSIGVDAEARVVLRLSCEAGFDFDFSNLPPDLLIEPVVTDAHLSLQEFRLLRVSNLSGPLIRELGKSLRGVLQEEIDKRRVKLVAKLNRQIDKRRDRLRLSLYELLRWDEVAELLRQKGIEVTQPEN